MPPAHLPRNDPHEWLNRAHSDLVCAKSSLTDVYLEDLCFHAQQCAEKAIKAIFVGRVEHFPFIHDLEELLRLLQQNGQPIPKYVWEAEKLTRYAVVTRYPGHSPPVTQRQHRRAVRIATAVLTWAVRQVAGRDKRPTRKQ
jgi:HEPN domain-containing protein